MKKIYYEKVGRRYVPVYEYDNDFLDAWPRGTHLVTCHPGGQSRRYNIDPNHAALIAAGIVAEADKLMANPTVKAAYDQFLFLCELTKESEKVS